MSEAKIKITNVRGLAVQSLLEICFDNVCGGGYDNRRLMPKWLVGCLSLIAMNAEGAVESLLQNIDNEPEFDEWLTLELIDLINKIHNGEIDSPATLATPVVAKPELPALVQNNIINIGRRPTEPETETKIVDAIASGKTALQIADETGVHRNTVSNIKKRHDIRPKRPAVELSPEREGRGVLGEMRRIIADLPEPFTFAQARNKLLEENPDLKRDEIQDAAKGAVQHLEVTENIVRAGKNGDGENLWIRSDTYTDKAKAGANKQRVIEHGTDNSWDSVADFIRECKPNLADHKVYYCVRSAAPMPDGRVIAYANGKGQRRPGEPFEPKEKTIEVKSKLVEQKRPTKFEGEPSQWICDACGHTIDVNPIGRSPAIRCAKCRGECWSGIKKPLAV